MLTYPPFMQRHTHFATAAVGSFPHALPAFPQFSSAAVTPQFTSSPIPVAAFALQAQIPSPVLSSPGHSKPEEQTQPDTKKNQQQGGSSKGSFSIASILARDDEKCKSRDLRREQQVPPSSLSPATPLSAGPKPNGFYYFYPPPAPQTFPPFAPQSCLDSELHRSALHGRLSAPVAVISEIVRNATGMSS